ncbi:MAG: hypothetical protein IIB42_01645 [Candidatus Marinimicrobia bacterium]|nr:hypothetical protein [Candidatus Neomarinimicrobiota bacterium]
MIRTRYLIPALFVFSMGLSANWQAEVVAVSQQDLDESLSQEEETTSIEATGTDTQDEPVGEEQLAPESAASAFDDVTLGESLEEPGIEELSAQETVLDSPDTSVRGVIYHRSPEEAMADAPLTLEAVVETVDAGVASVTIYHRVTGQLSYREVAMSQASPGLYVVTLAAADLQEDGLEYYLIAVLEDRSVIAYPTADPAKTPVTVPVSPNPETVAGSQDMFGGVMIEQSDLLILSPEPNETFGSEDVIVAISLFNLSDVDLSSIQLILDGVDVTAHADLSADIITYTPTNLSAGQHDIEFRATTLAGSAYQPVSWPFRVAGRISVRTDRAFQHSGTITPNFRRDDIDGEVLAVSSIRLNYRGGWNWFKFRSRLKLTSEEDPFKSPRNRFFIAFETPVLNLGLGDVTPRLNRFTLDGKRVRGYDADLNLKYFHLRIVQGELARGIQGRPGSAYGVDEYQAQAFESGLVDTLRLTRKGYSFKRNVLAVRPSLGSGERFQWSFSYVKAKDVISSVQSDVDGLVSITDSTFGARYFADVDIDSSTQARIVSFQDIVDVANASSQFDYVLPDSNWAGKSPEDNLVIGSDMTMVLSKRRFTIQTGFALSMLNKNIWDPVLSLEELDTFAPGDTSKDGMILGEIDLADLPDPADFEDYFHINLNQIPLLPFATDSASLANPLQLIAKMPSLAYHATAKLNYLNNFITMEFQQVGPDYNSLANPNIQKNVRIRSLSDRIRLFRNKLFLSLMYRSTDDDIVKLKDDNITSTVTVNLSGTLNLGFGLPGLSLGTRTYRRDNGIAFLDTIGNTDSDDTYIDRRNSTLTKSTTVGLTYRLQLAGSSHDLSLNLANTDISDQISDRQRGDTLYTTPNSPAASSNIISLSANSILTPKFRTNLALASNTSEFGEGATLISQQLISIALSARYQLLDGKLLVRGGFNRISSNSDDSGEDSSPPPNFSRLGIKGGLEVLLVDNLRWVTSLEFRTKQIEGISGSVGSSIITSNLQYRF